MNKYQIEAFNILKDDIIKNDDLEYNIIYIRDSYCLLQNNDKFYYIQAEYFGGYTITLYNKIDPNTKRQADYPQEVKSFNDILNYITVTKNKKYNNLKDTYNQVIFSDLKVIKNNITLEKYLKNIAGYREKYILDNLDYITEKEDNSNYHILYFYDKSGNYFGINTKNWDRLIIN